MKPSTAPQQTNLTATVEDSEDQHFKIDEEEEHNEKEDNSTPACCKPCGGNIRDFIYKSDYDKIVQRSCLKGGNGMKSILIKDTTREERERIVEESIGNVNGSCDGCATGLIEMYQDYIDGKKEIRDINMEFRAHFEADMDIPQKDGCGYVRT